MLSATAIREIRRRRAERPIDDDPIAPEAPLETADIIHLLMVDEARRHRLRLSRRHGTRRHAASRLPWDVSPGDR